MGQDDLQDEGKLGRFDRRKPKLSVKFELTFGTGEVKRESDLVTEIVKQ